MAFLAGGTSSLGVNRALGGITQGFSGITNYISASNQARAIRSQSKTNALNVLAQSRLDADAIRFKSRHDQRAADQQLKRIKDDLRIAKRARSREVQAEHRKIQQLTASQRVAFANQGIDISSGSARAVIDSDRLMGAQDIVTTQNNAARKVLGLKVQGIDIGLERDLSGISAGLQAELTLSAGQRNASIIKGVGSSEAKRTLITGGLKLAKSLSSGFEIAFGTPKTGERKVPIDIGVETPFGTTRQSSTGLFGGIPVRGGIVTPRRRASATGFA